MILAIGAHIHHVQIMSPVSDEVPNVDIVQVISPAVSPIYMNNPGYGAMKVSTDNGVDSLIFRFLQLEDIERLGVVRFVNHDIQKYTGVNLNDASSVRKYVQSLFYNY